MVFIFGPKRYFVSFNQKIPLNKIVVMLIVPYYKTNVPVATKIGTPLTNITKMTIIATFVP